MGELGFTYIEVRGSTIGSDVYYPAVGKVQGRLVATWPLTFAHFPDPVVTFVHEVWNVGHSWKDRNFNIKSMKP